MKPSVRLGRGRQSEAKGEGTFTLLDLNRPRPAQVCGTCDTGPWSLRVVVPAIDSKVADTVSSLLAVA